MDGSENPHHVGDGGSHSREAAGYSSAASLHGAECLALTDWDNPHEFRKSHKKREAAVLAASPMLVHPLFISE